MESSDYISNSDDHFWKAKTWASAFAIQDWRKDIQNLGTPRNRRVYIFWKLKQYRALCIIIPHWKNWTYQDFLFAVPVAFVISLVTMEQKDEEIEFEQDIDWIAGVPYIISHVENQCYNYKFWIYEGRDWFISSTRVELMIFLRQFETTRMWKTRDNLSEPPTSWIEKRPIGQYSKTINPWNLLWINWSKRWNLEN